MKLDRPYILIFVLAGTISTLLFCFMNCSGAGGGSDGGAAYYANWSCGGSGQCASVMGAPSGSQGPFSDYTSCYDWCQQYIPGNCSCSSSSNLAPGAPTITSISPSPVNSYTDIIVMGSNFPNSLSDISIVINGITITPVSVLNGGTELIFLLPAMGPYRGPVSITTPAGTATVPIVVTNDLHAVTWSPTKNLFLAVGDYGSILTSPDGVTWTTHPSTIGTYSNPALRTATWTDNQFVATSTGVVYTSPDGTTWTAHNTMAPGCGAGFGGFAWSGAIGIVAGGCSLIQSTSDFTTWTMRSSPVAALFSGIAWSGSTFLASGNGIVITSSDGTTWTNHTAGAQNSAVIWTQNGFMMVGSMIPSGKTNPVGMATTGIANGTTWSIPSQPSPNPLNGVTWSGSMFVVVGDAGAIATSADGHTWTAQTSGTTQKLYGVAWSGTEFVAVGAHGTTTTSSDGINWTVGIAP